MQNKNVNNKISVSFLSLSQNESLARSIVGCFALQLNPTIAEISDIKTAVSEAVKNCIVHAYPDSLGEIKIECENYNNAIHINVSDNGVGIDNLSEALEPFFTTKEKEERSGMGFTIMKNFMDEIKVDSVKNKGTSVYMVKKIKTDKNK